MANPTEQGVTARNDLPRCGVEGTYESVCIGHGEMSFRAESGDGHFTAT